MRSLLILGVFSTLWGIPETVLQDQLKLASFGAAVAFRTAATAWSALLLGGTVIASIELARGAKPTLSALFRGVRFSPAVFVALGSYVIPMEILERATIDAAPLVQVLALAVVVPAALALMLRGIAWVPFIVDGRLGPMEALRASWAATRGSTLRIAVLFVLLVMFAAPAGMLTFGNLVATHALGLVVWPAISVVSAEVYLALNPATDRPSPPAHPSAPMVPAPPAEDVPSKGTGWTRDLGRHARRR